MTRWLHSNFEYGGSTAAKLVDDHLPFIVKHNRNVTLMAREWCEATLGPAAADGFLWIVRGQDYPWNPDGKLGIWYNPDIGFYFSFGNVIDATEFKLLFG